MAFSLSKLTLCIIMSREIFRLAIPNIISNITVPLLSMVDMSIVGHMDSEKYIGAILLGTTLFNFIYWNFSFLRMGTSGFTAQAYGASDRQAQADTLTRSMAVAMAGGLIIIILQKLILETGFFFFKAEYEVQKFAADYFHIYIWAAPAVLGIYTFNGWYIGMQDARTPMFIAIGINVVNILLSLFFVYVLRLKIEGVALASLCAQYCGFIASGAVWNFRYKNVRKNIRLNILLHFEQFKPFFRVNSDIFIRTLALITVTTFFVSVSSRIGSDTLAVNALLMQLFTLFSYFMDGFAYAGEALTGKFVGAHNYGELRKLVKSLFQCGSIVALLYLLVYFLFFNQIMNILTDKVDLIALADRYHVWTLLIPICGFSAFLWDGIFVGATASKQMRNSMLIAVSIFFLIYFVTIAFDYFSNDILWLMFILYLALRGIVQTFMAKKINKRLFAH